MIFHFRVTRYVTRQQSWCSYLTPLLTHPSFARSKTCTSSSTESCLFSTAWLATPFSLWTTAMFSALQCAFSVSLYPSIACRGWQHIHTVMSRGITSTVVGVTCTHVPSRGRGRLVSRAEVLHLLVRPGADTSLLQQ